MIILLLLTFLIAAVIYDISSRIKSFRLREQLGLTGPKPHFLHGNVNLFLDIVKEKGAEFAPFIFPKLMEQYGNTFGFYRGTTLEIMTSDPEIIREVMITKFSSFVDRKSNALMKDFPMKESLLNIGEKGPHRVGWREIRSTVTAIFTPSKSRKMHSLASNSVRAFIEHLASETSGESKCVDILSEFQAVMMDVTAITELGINISCVTDRSNEFYMNARAFFANFQMHRSWFMRTTMSFPLISCFRRFSKFGRHELEVVKLLSNSLKTRVEERARGQIREEKDLVDHLLDANDKRKEKNEIPFHHDTLVSNLWGFFIAGYETSSTTLAFMAYHLAKHQTAHQLLMDELDEEFGDSKELDLDRLIKLPFLNAVYCETMRLCPPALTVTGRTCTSETILGGRYRVPPGVSVIAPVQCVMWNEQIYENPMEFIPERFLDVNTANSVDFFPFGIGPRNCVGARFAEMMVKTVIASVVRRFRILTDPEDPDLKLTSLNALLSPLSGCVYVKLEERTKH